MLDLVAARVTPKSARGGFWRSYIAKTGRSCSEWDPEMSALRGEPDTSPSTSASLRLANSGNHEVISKQVPLCWS
jgi:hypothetical protein